MTHVGGAFGWNIHLDYRLVTVPGYPELHQKARRA